MTRWLVPLFLLFAGASWWLASACLPVARGDDAFYKAPGVELVQSGKFCSPGAKGYIPRVEEIFAAYPPLYAFVFAGWVKVFGFSLESAVAFNHTLHLVGVLGMIAAAGMLIRFVGIPVAYKAQLLALLGIVHFGNMRFFDRQEELAFLFVWLELCIYLQLISRKYHCSVDSNKERTASAGENVSGSLMQAIVSGLCVGLAAFVGPWPGMLTALVVTLRTALEIRSGVPLGGSLTRLIASGIVATIPLGIWIAWLESHYPGLTLHQFREHVGRVPHIAFWQRPDVWASSWTYAPYQLPFLFVGLLFSPRVIGTPKSPEGRCVASMIITAALAIIFGACWRADSYVYLWSGLFLLFPCVIFGMALLLERTPTSGERGFLLALIAVTSVVALRDPVTLAVQAGQFPKEDRPQVVFARLHEIIPKEDLVAVTPRFWHAFQGRNPIRQTAILPWIGDEERMSWDWIILPEQHGTPPYRKKLLDGFELFETRPMSFTPFAPTFAPDERGWGYELWKKRDKK